MLLEMCPLRPNEAIRVDLPASWAPLRGPGGGRQSSVKSEHNSPSKEDQQDSPMTMTRLLDPLLLLLLLLPPVSCSFDPLVP